MEFSPQVMDQYTQNFLAFMNAADDFAIVSYTDMFGNTYRRLVDSNGHGAGWAADVPDNRIAKFAMEVQGLKFAEPVVPTGEDQ
ncbi:hypothetical protein [Micromonospora sp. CA-246542]|uniref:hypothetical protein n=1 Tax=Micromonospora sp. CA-246542 TaxID=3239959 RepID=UPI003D8C2CEA